jgi:hypothetical protein
MAWAPSRSTVGPRPISGRDYAADMLSTRSARYDAVGEQLMTGREGAKQAEEVTCLFVVELVVACKTLDVQHLVGPTCDNGPGMEMGTHFDMLSALRHENAEGDRSFRPECRQPS